MTPAEKFSGKEAPLVRRCQGFHGIRLDGIGDILHRARGASVFDIGCNRGLISYEFAVNGATRVMGCDLFEPGVETCRQVFADLRWAAHRFEICDLTGGAAALRKSFGKDAELVNDITVMLSTYHKLKRVMSDGDLTALMKHFGEKTGKFFCWRGHEDEISTIDRDLGGVGFKRVHTSFISDIQPAAIWARQ